MRHLTTVLPLMLAACSPSNDTTPASHSTPQVAPAVDSPAALSPQVRDLWMSTCSERWIDTSPPPPPPPPALDARWSRSRADAVSPPTVPPPSSTKAALPRWRNADRLFATLDLEDCDLTPLITLEPDHRDEEAYHCVMAFAYDRCGDVESATVMEQRRADRFPGSAGAQIALAVRTLAPLFSGSGDGAPYNTTLAAADRIAIADSALSQLRTIQRNHPSDVRPHQWSIMAHHQRFFARQIVEDPQTPEQALQTLLGRQDLMNAWRELRAIGELVQWPECRGAAAHQSPCRPLAPLSKAEVAADAIAWEALTTGSPSPP